MDLYAQTSYKLSEVLTGRYSTSFAASSRLFDSSIRKHIYAIYGLVRVADEIVDTYHGAHAGKYLDGLQHELHAALREGYSVNPIVHAFALTARKYKIGTDLTDPFFESMRMDLKKQTYTEVRYAAYIYGSAEVVGLMCLKVSVGDDAQEYERLRAGASALGRAYQKVNFLRDIKADYEQLGRTYFPHVRFATFSDHDKNEIVRDIEADFTVAYAAIRELPDCARTAVLSSYYCYAELLQKLKRASAADLKARRIRVHNGRKLALIARARFGS